MTWTKLTGALLSLTLAICLTTGSVLAATNATPQQVVINAQVGFGLQNLANSTILNYQEPNTTTAKFQNSVTIFLNPNSLNTLVNLATLFPGINTAVVYSVADISSAGQQVNIGMASSGSRFSMAPGGFFAVRVNGSAPTLYMDNPSLTNAAIIQVSVLAN